MKKFGLVIIGAHIGVHITKDIKEYKDQNILLIEPLDYGQFVWAMKYCKIILSDSGGVQEEGPFIGKPVVVLRENTERPEAVESGVAFLVGSNKKKIISKKYPISAKV